MRHDLAIGYDSLVDLRAYAFVALAMSAGACATVWGFEDAVDRPADGGASSSSSGSDGPVAAGEVTPSDVPGIMCAPRAPEGWQGPLAIFAARGAPLPPAPACPDRYDLALDGKADPIAPPGTCTCACDAASTTPCSAPLVTFYGQDTCTTVCGTPDQAIPSRNGTLGCTAFVNGDCPGSKWAKITTAKPGGSCTPKQQGLPAPIEWAAEVRVCAPKADVTATCPAGAAPAPASAFPYEPNNYCIAKRATSECPASYPRRRTFFDETQVKDTRGCKECSCGAPTGTCGGMAYTMDNPGNCGGGVTAFALPAVCGAVKSSNTGFGYDHQDAGGPVSCPPAGGGPLEGTVEPMSPITVCCRVE